MHIFQNGNEHNLLQSFKDCVLKNTIFRNEHNHYVSALFEKAQATENLETGIIWGFPELDT